jgi:hypothetical protein
MRLLTCVGFALALTLGACSSGDDEPEDEPEAGTGGNAGASGEGAGGEAGASGDDGSASGLSTAGVSGGSPRAGGGADPEGDAGPDDAMLDEDRPLSSLTGDELKFLCAELAVLADSIATEQDATRLSCILLAGAFSGAGASFDVAACEAQVDQCLISDDGWISTMRCEVQAFHEATLDCHISIAQYRQCLVASAEVLAEWIDTYSCQSFAEASTQAPGGESSSVAECAPVMAACPALFQNGTSGPAPNGCDDSCLDSKDEFCDDGGPGSLTRTCPLGTDCSDCGPR